MLRVWMASGEMLAAIPVESLSDVRSLKHHLHQTYAVPLFRQVVLQDCEIQDDSASLLSPGDVQLVVRNTFSTTPHAEVQDFLRLVRDGRVSEVEDVLMRFHDPNLPRGLPLDCASESGHLEIVRLLLQAGARISPECLAVASGAGHTEVVGALLEARADPESRREGRFSALLCASNNGHAGVVRTLLEASAAEEGSASLDWAAKLGHLEVVHLLVQAGFGSHEVDGPLDGTRLLSAARGGQVEVASLLLDVGLIRGWGQHALSPASPALQWYADALSEASGHGHIKVVRLLLEAAATAAALDVTGLLWTRLPGTPLIETSETGHVEVVRVLLQAGASPNLTDKDGLLPGAQPPRSVAQHLAGRTALMATCEAGHVEVASLFVGGRRCHRLA